VVQKIRVAKEGTITDSKGLSQDIEPNKRKRRLDPETKYHIFFETTRDNIPRAEVFEEIGWFT
jgi:hypothetical protein